MIELSVPYNEPYIARPSGVTLPPDRIGINGRAYVLDTKSDDWRREGIEVVQQRNTTSNRDILLLPQNVWRHQDESWHMGEGQRNRDREDAETARYWHSFGINPFTKYEMSLLNETESVYTLGDKKTWLFTHKQHLVIAHDDDLIWIPDGGGTPVVQDIGNEIISAVYDGYAIWTLHSGGVIKSTSSSTVSTTFTFTNPDGSGLPANATLLAYQKDYLLAVIGQEIIDITPTPGASSAVGKLIYTSPIADFTWFGACDGPNAIYMIGGSGDKTIIHRLSVKDDGTGLLPGVVAGQLPDGEIGLSISSYLGYVFIGSDSGIRMAQPDNGGDLTLGALLQTNTPIRSFEGQDRFVWAGADGLNPITPEGYAIPGCPSEAVPGLYRVDLSTFTVGAFAPAYAQDLHAALSNTGPVTSVTTWQGKRVFAVQGEAVYAETDSKVPTGWLETGRISYSVEDMKTGLYAQAKWEPLNGTIKIALIYDGQPPTSILTWSIKGSVRSGNIPLNGAQFSRVDPIYILERDSLSHSLGPILTRFELRARAAKGKASRFYLPILNHEELDLNGVIEARDVNDEFDILIGLVESGAMFSLQEGKRVYQAVAVDYQWKPQKLTTQGDGWQGVFILVCEEVR